MRSFCAHLKRATVKGDEDMAKLLFSNHVFFLYVIFVAFWSNIRGRFFTRNSRCFLTHDSPTRVLCTLSHYTTFAYTRFLHVFPVDF